MDDPIILLIKKAYDRKISVRTGYSYFNPDQNITYAEAIKMIVSALGLENLAPWPAAVTPYVDNDSIPTYARMRRLSIVWASSRGDERGFFNPSGFITNEQAARLFYSLIQYMGDELVKDYSDRMLSF